MRAQPLRASSPAATVTAPAPLRALYVHIPFCHTICPFCAFAVHGSRDRLHGPFVASLLREIELAEPEFAPGAIDSVYVGGGTPSTLGAERIGRILAKVRERFEPAAGAEIALEVNPEDAAAEYLAQLKALGVTRLSVGLQSLDDATLQALGRSHTAVQAAQAYDAARQAGFDNVNVDLMFGAPGIGPEAFRRDVERVGDWRPAHISLYGLDIEERTPFGRNPVIRAWADAHREEQAEQYLWAAETLEGLGYVHYEVSNFCLPGREGRQNLRVWNGCGYLGFGPGAHSYLGGRRWANERHLKAYEERLARGERPVAFEERLTQVQQANEALLLALRQRAGLDVAGWEARFGVAWGQSRTRASGEMVQRGLAAREGGRLRLTRRGMVLADEITARLLVVDPECSESRP